MTPLFHTLLATDLEIRTVSDSVLIMDFPYFASVEGYLAVMIIHSEGKDLWL
jgi:hypothetical protein